MEIKSAFVEKSSSQLNTISSPYLHHLDDNDNNKTVSSTGKPNLKLRGRQTFPKCSPKLCKKRVSFNLKRSDSFTDDDNHLNDNCRPINNNDTHSHTTTSQSSNYNSISTSVSIERNEIISSTNATPAVSDISALKCEVLNLPTDPSDLETSGVTLSRSDSLNDASPAAADSETTTNNTTNTTDGNNNNNANDLRSMKDILKTTIINRNMLTFRLNCGHDSGYGSDGSSKTTPLHFDETSYDQIILNPSNTNSSVSDHHIPSVSNPDISTSVKKPRGLSAERFAATQLNAPCRTECLNNGYSSAKTHRRKASLGTKDFAAIFPNLVADNFEYRRRVVV